MSYVDEQIPLGQEGEKAKAARRLGARLKRLAVAVGAVLLVVALLAHQKASDRRRRARVDVINLTRAVHAFLVDQDRCPADLEELRHPPGNTRPYVNRVPDDPWGRPYRLVCPGGKDPARPRVESGGPEGIFGSRYSVGSP